MERHRRTIVKTLTWRVAAVAITWPVVYFYKRDAGLSTSIALTANLLKTALYYLHERIWNHILFGKSEA